MDRPTNRYSLTEFSVGLFVFFGLLALGYISVSIGGLELSRNRIHVKARFSSVGDLKSGAAVKIAGVRVGSVRSIALENYAADVELSLDSDVPLPRDTIASIRTEGLLGESYVLLRPGGSEDDLAEGGRIPQTEPALDLIDLLVKYALSSDEEEGTSPPPKEDEPLGDLFQ
ncbi:MAG: outer membrane lipid asymmetry maintenance protein MlaD [Myxococcota bacterium]